MDFVWPENIESWTSENFGKDFLGLSYVPDEFTADHLND